MKEIQLKSGHQVQVDEEDFTYLTSFTWCLRTHRGKILSVKTSFLGRFINMHTLLMKPDKGLCVDHIDGNPLNNQKNNLRICTFKQNSYNVKKQIGTSSKYKGVYWNNRAQKWQAYIRIEGRAKNLGTFFCEHEAAKRYNEVASKNFGEFAKLNQIYEETKN